MTVVTYRDGMMAADTMCLDDELDQKYFRTKIEVFDDAVIGGSGEDRDIDRFISWWRAGRPEPAPVIKKGEVGMIVAYTNGRVEIWTDAKYGFLVTDAYCAVGSGSHVALGAMHAGATAIAAICAAIEHVPTVGGTIDAIDVRTREFKNLS